MFKVGDRVRRKRGFSLEGREGVVVRVEDGIVRVDFGRRDTYFGSYAERLEPLFPHGEDEELNLDA